MQMQRLREALTLLGPVVPRKTTLPVLVNVLLRDGQAVATDLEVAVAVGLPEADHAVLLPYREAAELLKHIPGAETLTIGRVGKRTQLSWSDGKATLEAAEPEDYPPLPQLQPKVEEAVDGDTLVPALLSMVDYCATDQDRPVLTGVTVQLGEAMVLAAGDGYRMAYHTIPMGFPPPEGLERVVIPARAVRVLGHLWARAPRCIGELALVESLAQLSVAKRRLELGLTREALRVRFGGVTLTTQLIQGTPPNWRQLIPEEPPLKVKAMAADLERAVKRIREVARDSKGIVRLVWSGDSLAVSARSDESQVEASVPVIAEGGEGRVAINMSYLLDYLKGREGMVEMGVTTQSSPVLFRHGHSPLVVIMPMFVQWDGPAPQPAGQAPAAQPEPEPEAQPAPTAEAEAKAEAQAGPATEAETQAKPRRRGRARA